MNKRARRIRLGPVLLAVLGAALAIVAWRDRIAAAGNQGPFHVSGARFERYESEAITRLDGDPVRWIVHARGPKDELMIFEVGAYLAEGLETERRFRAIRSGGRVFAWFAGERDAPEIGGLWTGLASLLCFAFLGALELRAGRSSRLASGHSDSAMVSSS